GNRSRCARGEIFTSSLSARSWRLELPCLSSRFVQSLSCSLALTNLQGKFQLKPRHLYNNPDPRQMQPPPRGGRLRPPRKVDADSLESASKHMAKFRKRDFATPGAQIWRHRLGSRAPGETRREDRHATGQEGIRGVRELESARTWGV